MSSSSERQYSIDELKKRNQPQEPQMMPPAPACPTQEQWTELLTLLDAQRRLLVAMGSTMGTMTAQAETLVKEVAEIRQQLQQAGKKKEWWLSLPKIPLPTPSLAWLWAIPILVGLLAIWYGWVTVWSAISPLLQLPQ